MLITSGGLEVTTTLLKHNPDVNIADSNGQTALMVAAIGSADVVSYLLHSGANVNTQDNDGKTALHYACSAGHLKSVQKLLLHHPDMNVQDVVGCLGIYVVAVLSQSCLSLATRL